MTAQKLLQMKSTKLSTNKLILLTLHRNKFFGENMKIRNFIIYLICLPFILISCTTNFSDLKRSSGNKLFDASGYQSNKRRPLYNKKYINKAKKNVITSDYEEDDDSEDDEVINPTKRNIDMYKQMVGSRKAKSRPNFQRKKNEYLEEMNEDEEEGNLAESRSRLSRAGDGKRKEDLEKEISEIKVMLEKTKDEITKAKCPYTEAEENKKSAAKPQKKTVSHEQDGEEEINNEIRKMNNNRIVAPPRAGSMTSVAQPHN